MSPSYSLLSVYANKYKYKQRDVSAITHTNQGHNVTTVAPAYTDIQGEHKKVAPLRLLLIF